MDFPSFLQRFPIPKGLGPGLRAKLPGHSLSPLCLNLHLCTLHVAFGGPRTPPGDLFTGFLPLRVSHCPSSPVLTT